MGLINHCNLCYTGIIMTDKEIIELRKRLKMTQQQFADAIGVDRVTVARWETGQKKPSNLAKRQLARLAKLK